MTMVIPATDALDIDYDVPDDECMGGIVLRQPDGNGGVIQIFIALRDVQVVCDAMLEARVKASSEAKSES